MSDVSAMIQRISDLERIVAVTDVSQAAIDDRLKAIEDTLKWLVRLIIGGMLLALLGFAMRGGLTIV